MQMVESLVCVCVCSVDLMTWRVAGGDAGNHSEESKAFAVAQPIDLLDFRILQHFPGSVAPSLAFSLDGRFCIFFLYMQISILAISKYSGIPSGSHHNYILENSDVCMCVFLALIDVLTIFNDINK